MQSYRKNQRSFHAWTLCHMFRIRSRQADGVQDPQWVILDIQHTFGWNFQSRIKNKPYINRYSIFYSYFEHMSAELGLVSGICEFANITGLCMPSQNPLPPRQDYTRCATRRVTIEAYHGNLPSVPCKTLVVRIERERFLIVRRKLPTKLSQRFPSQLTNTKYSAVNKAISRSLDPPQIHQPIKQQRPSYPPPPPPLTAHLPSFCISLP